MGTVLPEGKKREDAAVEQHMLKVGDVVEKEDEQPGCC